MVFISDTTLAIELADHMCLLYPSNAAAGPTKDSVLSGQLVLTLSRPKTVQRILVEFYGKQYIQLSGVHYNHETIRVSLTLHPFEQYGELQPGKHRFAFSFTIPANTAPFDFCAWGRTQHYIKATAFGCGTWKSDVVVREEIDLVANNAGDGQLAHGFERVTEGLSDFLGPYRLHLYSRHMLRGGYLRLSLSMASMNKPVRIDDIQVVLKQDTLLKSMSRSDLSDQKSTHILLWAMKGEGAAPLTLAAGKNLEILRHLRLAGTTSAIATEECVVRPSTSHFSDTGIRMEHSIRVTIRFTPLEGQDRAMREIKCSYPANIASCVCSIETLQLPSYSEHSESDSSLRKNRTIHDWRKKCLCHRPADNNLETLYAGASSGMLHEDHYGTTGERDRRPLWMDKVDGDVAGQTDHSTT